MVESTLKMRQINTERNLMIIEIMIMVVVVIMYRVEN